MANSETSTVLDVEFCHTQMNEFHLALFDMWAISADFIGSGSLFMCVTVLPDDRHHTFQEVLWEYLKTGTRAVAKRELFWETQFVYNHPFLSTWPGQLFVLSTVKETCDCNPLFEEIILRRVLIKHQGDHELSPYMYVISGF